jgi:hypothetical protein
MQCCLITISQPETKNIRKTVVKKSVAKYILVVWCSLLIMLGNTPMEFVHLFADHKDTVHHEGKGLCIENKHHHCAYLSLTITPFINDYQMLYVRFLPPSYLVMPEAVGVNYVQRCIIATSLRGPPAVLI